MTQAEPATSVSVDKYPPSLRVLHWLRALLIFGLIGVGWFMTSLDDEAAERFGELYPLHKSFGLLVLLIVLVQLGIRAVSRLPGPAELPKHERVLSHLVHVTIYALVLIVPLMGYAMSSSYAHSDGVTFFGLHVPELLPKNDTAFRVFQFLHKVLAYTLLGLVALHVAGALKHRFLDKNPKADVLPRMM
ncbi:cytochrome b/b6 domain-containing protein [Rhodopseudomonas palustris]|uniref:cytochrome b n=1 Tax=Rhodopseudomonas palustris TaxID=1076 RepID=UPI0020CFBDB9|nr:cytochrome b/b6 domain-containing protein [Rhodopseudomonas palustris]MCP9628718.1 cytochrome b/b6 domain-containing protein [Rhodopseudomonas palustris]